MSQPQFRPTARAERMLAGARLVLAVCSFLALSIEPSRPARLATLTPAVTIGYVVWAVAIAWLVASASLTRPRLWQRSIHAADLVVAIVFIILPTSTDGLFLLYLVFVLASATLRWDAPGALWTGGIVLAAYLGTVLTDLLRGAPVELHVVVIRSTCVLVLALMLAYIGASAAHVRRITLMLRTWQPDVSAGVAGVMAEAVGYVGAVLGARYVVLLLEEDDEPDLRMASLADGEVSTSHEDASAWRPLVAPPLQDTDFLCADVSAANPVVVGLPGEVLHRPPAPPVHPRLAERFAARRVLAAKCGEGRLFVIDEAGVTIDDLWLAQILARQISSSLEQASLAERLEANRLSEARARVAGDLHDGLLQSLTAVMLRLTTIGRTLSEDARRRLEGVQTIISEESRRLREFIQHLTSPTPEAAPVALSDRIDALRDHIEQDWDLRVELSTQGLQRVPDGMAHDVYFILREALINVARHAGASRARSTIEVDGDRMHIVVSDDGRGFSFEGRRDGAELAAANLGPRMLYERTRLLGGRLVVDSRTDGARLEIDVPLSSRNGR